MVIAYNEKLVYDLMDCFHSVYQNECGIFVGIHEAVYIIMFYVKWLTD